MELGIISDEKSEVEFLTSHFLNYFNINIYDNTNKRNISLTGNNKIVIYQKLNSFFSQSNYILLGFKNKKEVLHCIREWINFHDSGIIILVHFYEMGFADKINKWLKRKNKKIEITYFPLISNLFSIDKSNYYVFGGNIHGVHFRMLRITIAEKKPLLITTVEDAELICRLFNQVLLIEKAFLVETEQLIQGRDRNSDILKRVVTHHWNCNIINKPNNLAHIVQHQLKEIANQEQRIVSLAKHIIKEDQLWSIKQLNHLLSVTQINTVALLGEVTEDFLDMLTTLNVKNINIFPKRNKNYQRNQINDYNDLYLAAEEADVIIIFSINSDIESLSISKLTRFVRKKIMLDQIGLFEIEEIEPFNWYYLSKGSRKLNKQRNAWR